jgi:gamma-glutamyltranspeptidase/glutathione hydrolase
LRRFNTMAPMTLAKGKYTGWVRQCGLAMIFSLVGAVLSSCSNPLIPVGSVGHVSKYFGGVIADEPLAALVGRDVLSAGGTAADAVVAMSLAMMVTRPDAAGPGGGGVCVVYGTRENKAEALELMPHASLTPPESGRWIGSVPGTFRGLFALSARYGALRWEQLVLPAENMARFGIQLPRVLARNLVAHGQKLLKDPKARAIFADKNGRPYAEGTKIRQLDLAGLLGRIRSVGPGDFHSGPYARQYLDAVRAAGGWLTIDDLRNYRPIWNETIQLPAGNHILHFAPSPALGAVVTASIWRDLGDKSQFSSANAGTQALMMTNAARKAQQAALAPPSVGSGSAGALAIDRNGNAVACTLTMGHPFGTGRTMGDTGIIAVAPASFETTLLMAPSILANKNLKTALAAATASGDRNAGVALATVYSRLLDGKLSLDDALNLPRYAPGVSTGQILLEKRAPQPLRAELAAGGRTIIDVPTIGLVNIMYCPVGILDRPEDCAVRTDNRGYGHAINAEF